MCVCVCECVRACVWAWARVCVYFIYAEWRLFLNRILIIQFPTPVSLRKFQNTHIVSDWY
jgi:hypothetical protein